MSEEFYQEVLEAVKNCPGCRARLLPVDGWFVDVACALVDLEEKGLVRSEDRMDSANLEFYKVWYAA